MTSIFTLTPILISDIRYGPGQLLNAEALNPAPADAQLAVWRSEGKISNVVPGARQIMVAARTATTAQITWIVDEPSGFMQVEYGTTTALGSIQAATPVSGVGAIVADLTGLTTATLYYYRVRNCLLSGANCTFSARSTFTTL